MSKEPTRHQLSARLAYNAQTPAFLRKMQQRVSGVRSDDEDEDEEYEYDGSGRPPIPKRPTIPERPDNDPGSADEDDVDEKPQVVVLKEGKHLSAREVENEKRKEKGLSPLPDPDQKGASEQPLASQGTTSSSIDKKAPGQSLSFSSSGAAVKTKSAKRRALGDGRDDESPGESKAAARSKKKPKKAEKKLLSFGDGDEA